jgi:hypothetical protein
MVFVGGYDVGKECRVALALTVGVIVGRLWEDRVLVSRVSNSCGIVATKSLKERRSVCKGVLCEACNRCPNSKE